MAPDLRPGPRPRSCRSPEPLCEYVLGLAREVIRPEFRGQAGFDDPVEAPEDAGALSGRFSPLTRPLSRTALPLVVVRARRDSNP